MKRIIRLSKSVVGKAEKNALCAVMNAGYLGMGSFVQDFEEKIKSYLNAKHVICVNSGTAALHLACEAIGLNKDDEVLVQSLTYLATFQAISASGAKPVSCEVNPVTLTIELKDAMRKISRRTKAIIPVHYAGNPGELEKIYKFAKSQGLRVIEDAAHAFGSTYKGKKIGSFGDIICFSFDGIKNITSGEGGAVVTEDKKIAQYIMDARLLGVHKDTEKRYRGQRSWEFEVINQGYRYHMSNLFAAIGIVQLSRFEKEFLYRRQQLAKNYVNAFQDIPGIKLFPVSYDNVVPHIFPLRVLDGKRNALRAYFFRNNIETGIHYHPNHTLAYYGKRCGQLPVTEQIYTEIISLPLHPDLTNSDQDRVITCLKSFFSRSGK